MNSSPAYVGGQEVDFYIEFIVEDFRILGRDGLYIKLQE